MREEQAFDVAIIGGGPAGSAAAIALARSGRSVTLIERTTYGEVRIGETLPPRARPLLAELGVDKKFEQAQHIESPGVVSAWGSAMPYGNDFIANPYGNGWHVDRACFDRMLASHATDAGAFLHEQATVIHCEATTNGWRIALGDAPKVPAVTCRFVVDASGRRASALKRRAGRRSIHDRLIGIAAYIATNNVTDTRTLIEAAPDGWWYSSPLPAGQVCVFMTDADLAADRRRDLAATMRKRLETAPLTRARIGSLHANIEVSPFAAMTYTRADFHGSNWLLAGDAACTWDPLSGQGICKALDSGIRAATAIQRALDGDERGLGEYATWTRSTFDKYLTSRSKYYRAEQRWPDSPFWRRRHAVN